MNNDNNININNEQPVSTYHNQCSNSTNWYNNLQNLVQRTKYDTWLISLIRWSKSTIVKWKWVNIINNCQNDDNICNTTIYHNNTNNTNNSNTNNIDNSQNCTSNNNNSNNNTNSNSNIDTNHNTTKNSNNSTDDYNNKINNHNNNNNWNWSDTWLKNKRLSGRSPL